MVIENRLPAGAAILPLAFFFLGVFSIVAQAMMIREFLLVVYGNELILGVLFFNWLLGIFVGAWVGSRTADRSRQPALLFVLSLLAMTVLLPVCLTGTRFLYLLSGTAAGTYVGFFAVFLFSALLIIPLVFFIGFGFPLAAKLQSAGTVDRGDKVRKISLIYVLEALGFLVGGMVYTFFLVGRVGPYTIAPLAALPLAAASVVILRRSKFYKTSLLALLLAILNLVAVLSPLSGKLESFTLEKRWQSVSSIPLLYSLDSKFQNITVTRLFNQYHLYLNGHFASVFPDDDENPILAAHLVCQHPDPKRVLVIGDALTGLARYLLAYNLERVVSVEIDPHVVQSLLRFLPKEEKQVLAERRFHLEIADGRKYVKDLRIDAPYFDLVYLNAAEPATLLANRYYTREFFLDLARILEPDGVVAFQITSSENYGAGLVGDYTAILYHTVKSVFPQVKVAPGTKNFIFASRKPDTVSDDPAVLEQRYARTGMKPEKLGVIFKSLYPQQKTKFIKSALEESRQHKINRDGSPVANFYFSKIIGWYAGGAGLNLAALLGVFEKIGLKELLLFCFILLSCRLVYLWANRRTLARIRALQFHTMVAVFSCGMAGLSLELVILYAFQNVFGYIYHVVGLIIAVFMFGLPVGALFANLLIHKKQGKEAGIIKLLIAVQVSLAVAALILARLNRLLVGSMLLDHLFIFFLTIVVGFLVGMVFPLAIHVYLSGQEKSGRAAGKVDAFDHLGAALGALFMGTLFLPLLGVFKTCLLLTVFLLLSCALLLTDLHRAR